MNDKEIDVTSLVRCRDCEYFELYFEEEGNFQCGTCHCTHGTVTGDNFCSYGKKGSYLKKKEEEKKKKKRDKDLVKVIRCKDCANAADCNRKGVILCSKLCRYMYEEGFCCLGLRRSDDTK